jgi:hypothetical protein
MRSKADKNIAKSTNLLDIPSLITVWLQVRVLPGPPANQWLSCVSFHGLSVTVPEMHRFVAPSDASAVLKLLPWLRSDYDLST